MKQSIIFLLALTFFIGCSKSTSTTDPNNINANVPPGWAETDSLTFGQYNVPVSMAVNGNTMMMLSGFGIFATSDDGLTINKLSGLYFDKGSKNIFVKDNYFFVGIGHGLFRTADNGVTWTDINAGADGVANYGPTAFFVYNNTLYAGTGSGNIPVYRSNDNGNTWTNASAGVTAGYGGGLTVINKKLFVNPTSLGKWFSSADGGTSWTAYTGPAIAVLNESASYSYYTCNAVTADGTTLVGRRTYTVPDTVALWGAPSGSETFTPRMNGINGRAITNIVVSGNHVFAAGAGIFHSTDNGMTWTDITPAKPYFSTYYSLAIAHGILFAGGDSQGYGFLVRRPLSDFN